MMPSTEPSKSPTQAPVIITASPITPAPSSAPTRLPYLHDASSRIVGTLDSFLVSLYSPEISLQVQESTLTDILNLALCSISGVQLVTTELEPVPACGTISGGEGQGQGKEQGQGRALAEYDNENTDNDEHAMVVWNVPLAQATWQWLEYLEDGRMSLSLLNSTTNTTTLEYVQWNLTYRVLQFGTTSSTATAMPHMLQELWNQSITSGRLDTALQNEWPHTTTTTATSLIGNEWESFKATAISSADANNHSPMLWEVPARSVEVLRWLGVAMCVWMVLSVALVTVLARRHRQHKAMAEESSVEILFSTRPREEEEEEKEPSDGPLYGAAAAPQEGLPSLEPTSSRGLEFMLRQSRNFVQDNPHMQRVPKSARGGGTTTNSISPSVLLLQSFDDIYDNDDDFVVTGITSTTSSNGRSVSRRSLSPRSSVRQRYIDRLSQNNHSSTYSATTTPSRDGEPSLLFHLNVEEDQEHDIAF